MSKKQDEENENTVFVGTIFHQVENWLNNYYDIRFNEISLNIEIKEKHENEYNIFNENTIWLRLQKGGIKIPMNSLLAIIKSDFIQSYNPLKHYFKTLPKWDEKTDYIERFASYVTLVDDKLFYQFYYSFKKWLVRTVKSVLYKEYYNKQAFVLADAPNIKGQNIGKTYFLRYLVPKTLKDYIAEDISNDKDARILICKNFIINIDELSTLSKRDANHLKAFFSKSQINERLPYGRTNVIIPRVASFVGSTNMTTFLQDETGSVRWMIFAVLKIDWSYSTEFDINNLWAQAYHLANDPNFDEKFNVDDVRENEKRNKQYQVVTAEQELIMKYFKVPSSIDNPRVEFLQPSEILIKLSQVAPKIRMHNNNIGKALKAIGYDRIKKYGRYGYYLEHINDDETLKHIFPTN